MIQSTLAVGSLFVLMAVAPEIELGPKRAGLSNQERAAALQPSITRATACVARSVAAAPHSSDASKLGDLIVDSMPACAALMRSMIDNYDQYFGNGAGEAFFSGPYLDVLPTAISKWVMGQTNFTSNRR